MAVIKVRTQPSDYFKGECFSRTTCALALAIQRATRDPFWSVDGDAVVNERRCVFCIAPEWFDREAQAFDMMVEEDGSIACGHNLIEFTLDTKTGEIDNRRWIGYVSDEAIAEARGTVTLYG